MLAKNTPIIFKTLPKRIKLSTIKSYKNFIIFTTPQAAINTLSLGLPVILLSTYTGTNNAGYFALTATVLAIPANLIGTSTAQAFYKKAIDSKHKGKVISNEVKSLTRTMLLAALLPFLIIMIQAPNIFSIIFGESWREAGVYAQILAPYYFLSLLNKPAVAVLPIIGAQSGLLAYEIIATTLRASTLIAALHFQVGEKTALALYSAIGSAAYIALILWSFRATKNAEAT
jgi:O-antigen/teichoic acid export membrane protein